MLYQQLSAWLLHGLLTDSHDEFLITRVTSQHVHPLGSAQGVTDLGIPGLTGKQLPDIMVPTSYYKVITALAIIYQTNFVCCLLWL